MLFASIIKNMSEVSLVAITTIGSLLTVLISRVRFIFRPCSEDPEKFANQVVVSIGSIEKRMKYL